MKTAVSIPDTLFAAADALARRRGISRSRLYAQALTNELGREADAAITAQLDEVCGGIDSSVPVDVAVAQARAIRSEW